MKQLGWLLTELNEQFSITVNYKHQGGTSKQVKDDKSIEEIMVIS